VKNDMGLLLGIGAVLAIALSIAAARGVLGTPAVLNPLEGWSTWQALGAVALALLATLAAGAAIVRNDKPLHPRNSALLEWVYSSDEAKNVVQQYGEHRSTAIRGVLIDSLAFIPAYVFWIALLAFAVARGWTAQSWAAWVVVLGWSAVLTGALDHLENAGIYAALSGVTTKAAPLTYAFCQLKWVLGFTAAFFALIAAGARLIGRS
jgi:hypothetical protein